MSKVNINTRELCINYPTWEQLAARMSTITAQIKEDLLSMGDEQYVDKLTIREHNGKYQLIYTLQAK